MSYTFFSQPLGFEVWVTGNVFANEQVSYCCATFYFWGDCLDYKNEINRQGIPCVLRSFMPSGTWKSEWRYAASGTVAK